MTKLHMSFAVNAESIPRFSLQYSMGCSSLDISKGSPLKLSIHKNIFHTNIVANTDDY